MGSRTAAPPDLNGPFVGKQQPAEAGAVGLIDVHFVAQGGDASGAFVAGTGTTGASKFHH